MDGDMRRYIHYDVWNVAMNIYSEIFDSKDFNYIDSIRKFKMSFFLLCAQTIFTKKSFLVGSSLYMYVEFFH